MIKFSVVQTGVRIKYPNLDAKTKVMAIFQVSPGKRTQVLFLFILKWIFFKHFFFLKSFFVKLFSPLPFRAKPISSPKSSIVTHWISFCAHFEVHFNLPCCAKTCSSPQLFVTHRASFNANFQRVTLLRWPSALSLCFLRLIFTCFHMPYYKTLACFS